MPVNDGDSSMFDADLISNAMKLLVESITHRIGFLNEYQSIMDPSDPDIRYISQICFYIIIKSINVFVLYFFNLALLCVCFVMIHIRLKVY